MARKKGLLSKIWWRLPGRVRWHFIQAMTLPGDTLNTLLGRRDPLTPPASLTRAHTGRGDFRKSGEITLKLLIDYCNLKPDSQVLDGGCGAGRVAVALTGYLNAQGRYEGFDLSDYPINWCRQNITPRYPNFQFQVADVYSAFYNPRGKFRSAEYPFPYPDNTFDVVHLGSVFTHMLPEDVDHYLAEIARVSKPGSRSFITYLLINDHSRRAADAPDARQPFKYRYDDQGYWVGSKDTPEESTALDETMVRGFYDKHGLRIIEPVYYGSWAGQTGGLWSQDVIIAEKV